MDSRQLTSKVINAVLSTVRGPAFLSLLSLVLLFGVIPANATLLCGYLNADTTAAGTVSPKLTHRHKARRANRPHKHECTTLSRSIDLPQSSSTVVSNSGENATSLYSLPRAAQYTSIAPQSAALVPPRSTYAIAPQLDPRVYAGLSGTAANNYTHNYSMQPALPADSFPVTFEGNWKCVTVVVDSAVPAIPVGQRVESQVSFWPQEDGRVVAHWAQNGWNNAHETINTISSVEANLERTNYFVEAGPNAGWAAHSRDHYIQIDPNRIAATSSVDQFASGQFLGQYRTRSMLFRLNGNIAMAPAQR